MNKIKVSAVSYTNTKPFIYGLEHSNIKQEIDLCLDIPSSCAQKLIDNQVDIGLIPVAALLNIPEYYLISDYCIAAVGEVNSVFIFSTKPIYEVETLSFDVQSRTSNALAQILLKHHWKVQPEISIIKQDAFVEIGDRTFGKANDYPYVYDLAKEWMNFCGLPFVFAVWASNKLIDKSFITRFNIALQLGLDNIDHVLNELPNYQNFDISDYLHNKIDYQLTNDKRIALNKFLTLAKEI